MFASLSASTNLKAYLIQFPYSEIFKSDFASGSGGPGIGLGMMRCGSRYPSGHLLFVSPMADGLRTTT
jgi:hypothetical protein